MGFNIIRQLMAKDYAEEAISPYSMKARDQQQASNSWPSAKNAWEACNSEGFIDYLHAIRDDLLPEGTRWYNLEYNERAQYAATALREVLKRDPYALDSLTNEALASVASELTLLADDEVVDAELLDKIYQKYDIYEDKDFQLFDLQKKTELLKRLSQDEEIQNARANWSHLSLDERLDVARRIHETQADVYGFKPIPIGAKDLESDTVMAETTKKMGQSKITFNTNERSLWEQYVDQDPEMTINSNDFDDFLNTITHESEHVFQHYLTDKLIDLKMKERDILEPDNTSRRFLNEEQLDQLNQKLMQWAEEKFPEMDPEVRRQLIEGGGIREMAEMTRQSSYNKPQADDQMSRKEAYSYYRNLPHEVNAWAMGDFFAEVFGPLGPEMIQQMEQRIEMLEQEQATKEAPTSQASDGPASCDNIDPNLKRETILSSTF